MTDPAARPTIAATRDAPLRGAAHVRVVLVPVLLVLVVLGWLLSAPHTAAADAGEWGWPVAGPPRVVRGFDPPAVRWGPGHRGADLLTQVGAEVRAAGAGRVTFAGPLAGRDVVVVAHGDGTRTTYEPLVPAVAVGDRVATGDLLGRLAASPGHCLPSACLHWGLLRGTVYLDPLALVRVPRARLLPIWGEGPGQAPPGPGAVERAGGRSSAVAVAAGRNDGPGASVRPWRLVAADRPATSALALVVILAGSTALASRARFGRRR